MYARLHQQYQTYCCCVGLLITLGLLARQSVILNISVVYLVPLRDDCLPRDLLFLFYFVPHCSLPSQCISISINLYCPPPPPPPPLSLSLYKKVNESSTAVLYSEPSSDCPDLLQTRKTIFYQSGQIHFWSAKCVVCFYEVKGIGIP